MDEAKLLAALKAAKEAAEAVVGADGGTVNFDSAVLYMKRGERESDYKRVVAAAGLTGRCSKTKSRGRLFFLNTPGPGAAGLRNAKAEKMCEVLYEHGIENVSMWWQSD